MQFIVCKFLHVVPDAKEIGNCAVNGLVLHHQFMQSLLIHLPEILFDIQVLLSLLKLSRED